ncbi:MAG: acetamidase/formamidase family protein [Alphaproteobacteria bacterium]|nr:acetamidase/formamidase family protein [Alphaproteobacteria bacterium]
MAPPKKPRAAHRAKPGPFAEFIDELSRLALIGPEERAFLAKGLQSRAVRDFLATDAPSERQAKPTAAAGSISDALAKRARKAGLVRETGDNMFHVKSGPETVHWGYLWSAAEPILRVAPGATVTIDTVSHEGLLADQGDPVGFFKRFGIPKAEVLGDAIAIYAKVQHSGAGPHIVSAPVYVEGAEPGDVLAVHVLAAEPRVPYGVNSARLGKGTLPAEFTLNRSLVIPFDMEASVARFAPGIAIPLKPFFGIMATGPALTLGKLNSVPPGPYGGNIDLNELTAGSTLYLPVHVPGALFMTGDGHAAQGDGEVNLTAIETSLTGTFRLELLKQKFWSLPRAETATHWITMGLHESLDEAMRIAVRETIKFLGEVHGLDPADAYALASVAIDFEVTQNVDGVKGIHAMIPKAIFQAAP